MSGECRCAEAIYEVTGNLAIKPDWHYVGKNRSPWRYIGKYRVKAKALQVAVQAAEDPKWRKVLVRRSIHFTEEVVTLTNPEHVLEGGHERQGKDGDVSEQGRGDGHEACPHCGTCGSHAHAGQAVGSGVPGAGGTEEDDPTKRLMALLIKSEYERFFHVAPNSMYAGVHRWLGLQLWVRDVVYIGAVCSLCSAQLYHEEHAYYPVTNLSNQKARICDRCMQGVPPNA